jgi:hypothetical protein
VGAITVQRHDFTLPDGMTVGVAVNCPAGTKVIGGGSSIDATAEDDIHPVASRPSLGSVPNGPADGKALDGWRVTYSNAVGGLGTTVHAFAICAEL